VRQVIDASGRSQSAFAQAIGLEPTKLSKALAGTRRFTPLELALIAEEGGRSTDWLLGGLQERPTLAARVAQASTSDVIAQAGARAEELDEVYETLLAAGRSRRTPPKIIPVWAAGLMIDQGANLAEQALQAVADAEESKRLATMLPLVIEWVFGVDVAIESFPGGLDGLAWCRDGFRLILVSNAVSWTRQRFTLAHELGHVLAGDAQDLRVDLDVMAASTRREHTEMRANAFASAFLMPARRITQSWRNAGQDTFSRLVGELRVSPSALFSRLHNLGLVDEVQRRQLCRLTLRECAERGGWAEEHLALTRSQSDVRRPGLLSREVLDAFAHGEVSARVAARVLGIPPETLLPAAPSTLPGSEDGHCADEDGLVFVP
jgi:Zn-dependent peptidase ImmA (M78 family)/transcriptional regulator with XRE-family HTH domain